MKRRSLLKHAATAPAFGIAARLGGEGAGVEPEATEQKAPELPHDCFQRPNY